MRKAQLELPRLHIVTDDPILDRGDVVKVAAALLEALPGRVAVHIRGPHTSGRRVYEVVSAVAAQAGTEGLFVNDRIDIARAVGSGIHLGGRSLSVAQARHLLPHSPLVGRSVREATEALPLNDAGAADFVFAGSVYDTPSHPGLVGRGVEWFSELASRVSVPVMAIGGISAENIGVLLDAGAYGIATIRAVWGSSDPVAAAEQLTKRLEQASRPEPMDE